MLLDPKVEIECNQCAHFEAFDLTALANSCYDERSVRSQSERAGWIWAGDNVHYCSEDCAPTQESSE